MLMNVSLSEYVSSLAVRSILYEVSASPKPGLVDRFNPGAHKDMDYFTFVDSCTAIADDLRKMALAGENWKGDDISGLFEEIRLIGIDTEKKMFHATGGINTHKGIIFSIGILSAASAYLMGKRECRTVVAEEVCELVPMMVGNICQRELNNLQDKAVLTNGEKLYEKYKFKGIRGEVESGFRTVIGSGMPIMRKYAGTREKNEVLVNALLSLMTETEDSNIVHRHNTMTLKYVKRKAGNALEYGGMFTNQGKSYIQDMDQDFIEQQISPGGSADLLAVTIFLALLEGIDMQTASCGNVTKNIFVIR